MNRFSSFKFRYFIMYIKPRSCYMSGFKGTIKTDISSLRTTKYAIIVPVRCLDIYPHSSGTKSDF